MLHFAESDIEGFEETGSDATEAEMDVEDEDSDTIDYELDREMLDDSDENDFEEIYSDEFWDRKS